MSLTSSLQRIVQAKADIKTAIENKGVTVGDDVSITNYDDYIDAIQTGSSTPTQTKTVALSMASGDQVISPDTGYALSQVTVEKPLTLIATNIKNGVTIGGVEGSYTGEAPNLTTKNISVNGTYYASNDGADGYSSVSVDVSGGFSIPNVGQAGMSYSNMNYRLYLNYANTWTDIDTFKSTYSAYNPEISIKVEITDGVSTNTIIKTEDEIRNAPSYTNTINLTGYLFSGTNTIKIYTIATLNGSNYYSLSYSFAFDTVVVSVTYKSSNNTNLTPLQQQGCACVGDYVYLFGGYSASTARVDTITALNIRTAGHSSSPTYRWDNIGTMPVPINLCSAVTYGTDIYICGGRDNNGYFGNIYKFNALTNQISLVGNSSYSAGGMGVAIVGDNIYMFGGQPTAQTRTNAICKYNITSGTTTSLSATLATAVSKCACCAVGTDIYIFGGLTLSGPINTIQKFDTLTNTITTLPTTLPTNLQAPAVGYFQSKNTILIAGGGTTSGDDSGQRNIYYFDVSDESISVSKQYLTYYVMQTSYCNVGANEMFVGLGCETIIGYVQQSNICNYLYPNN